MEEDIIDVDLLVKDKLDKEKKEKLVFCKNTIDSIENLLVTYSGDTQDKKTIYINKLEIELNNIKNKFNSIENNENINFYLIDSLEILDECNKTINRPKKIDFMGKVVKHEGVENKGYDSFVFNSIFLKDIYHPFLKKENKKKIKCLNCNVDNDFITENGDMVICNNCHYQKQMINIISYTDCNRVNPQSKYIYDRHQNFKNCIDQYQGKQCINIPDQVYLDIENQFEIHGLLIGDKDTPKHIRFKNITKTQINIFLKELKYSKYYEDVYLIHYFLTSIKPDDIEYLEEKLMMDFYTLSTVYDRLFKKLINRKSFINTHYVFFQLLIKNKHKCIREDFIILKTIERKKFHDGICSRIFAEIGWNFTPIF